MGLLIDTGIGESRAAYISNKLKSFKQYKKPDVCVVDAVVALEGK
jgi:hypothetical protein